MKYSLPHNLVVLWKLSLKNLIIITQLAHDVVTTLGFACILVAASDNIVTTLSQRCASDVVTTMKN